VTDTPSYLFAHHLIPVYPNAKIILTTRDSPSAWKTSMMNTVVTTALSQASSQSTPLTRAIANMIAFFVPKTSISRFFTDSTMFDLVIKHSHLLDIPERGEEMYLEHNENIRRLAKQYHRPLLELNVKDGWKPLCEFLGKPIPKDEEGTEVPFPRVNGGEVYKRMNEEFQGKVVWEAVRGMGVWVAVAGLGVVGLWLWKGG
jgi:hypothetical protein